MQAAAKAALLVDDMDTLGSQPAIGHELRPFTCPWRAETQANGRLYQGVPQGAFGQSLGIDGDIVVHAAQLAAHGNTLGAAWSPWQAVDAIKQRIAPQHLRPARLAHSQST